MVNKKNIIGLSMLLLVFLLGLSSTAYASIESVDELKNFIFNVYAQNYSTGEINETRAETVRTYISTHGQDIQQVFNEMQSYNGYVIPAVLGSSVSVDSFPIMLTYNRFYSAGDGNYIQGLNKTYFINITRNRFESSGASALSGYSTTWHVYSASVPVYTSSSGSTIRHPAGDYPSNYLDGDYTVPPDPEMTFTPISPVGAEAIRVEDNVGIDCIGVEKNSTYKSMKFGDLYVPSYYYITNINVLWWYYNRGTDRWLYKYILQEDGDDITPSAYRSSIVNFKWEDSYKENETTIIHYSVWINRDFVINDTIYQIAVIGTKFKDGTPKFVGANYFIKSTYTTIVNGILDTDYIKNTPYGDEYNNIVGDIADKVDDLDDLTNSITAGIGNGLIGASGDWYPLNSLASGDDILGTAQLWGFRNYTNLYWQGIYQLLTNTFTVLGQTGSVDLDVSFHGYQKVISSDDIVSPPTAIKDFISLCMVTFTMIAIYRHFNKKIENIQAADTSKIKNEADDSNLM